MKRQLRYEFLDTLLSMGIGWMINSAMIILAAAVFFAHGIEVTELEQAEELLRPLIGPAAGIIFAIALLFAGFASSATAGMAGASIFAGMFGESYDMKDFHTRLGLALTYVPALLLIVFITDSFQALLFSQMFLSLQLPITIFLQLFFISYRHEKSQFLLGQPFIADEVFCKNVLHLQTITSFRNESSSIRLVW